MKAAKLLKLFEYFNSDNTSAKSEHHRLSEIKLKHESTKKTVRFINRKMVIPILLMIQSFSLITFKANAQANINYQWAKSLENDPMNIGNCYGFSVKIDAAQNVYTAGTYQGKANFGGSSNIHHTSMGFADIFITKRNAVNNLVYAISIGGAGGEFATEIAVDATGNVYITGEFSGTADFDPGPGTYNLTSSSLGANPWNGFFAKYDATGNLIYAKVLSSTDWCRGDAITTDASGNVYITGFFTEATDFDPSTSTNATLTPSGTDANAFVAKYDASGNYVFVKHLSGNYTTTSQIALDPSNNIYITGTMFGTIDLDPGAANAPFVSSYDFGAFFAKYSSNGDYLFGKQLENLALTSSSALITGLKVDNSGNIYVSGNLYGTVDFNPSPAVVNLTSAGDGDCYFAKYDASGNYIFAKSFGNLNTDNTQSLTIDADHNIYLLGSYQSIVDFDPGAGDESFTCTGTNDIYIAKYDASGNYVFAKTMNGTDAAYGLDIQLKSSGNIVITGHLKGNVDFNPGTYNTNINVGLNYSASYLAEYNNSGDLVSAFTNSRGYEDAQNYPHALKKDVSGNLIMAGSFSNTIDFDLGPGITKLTSNSNASIYFAKYNDAGSLIYAKTLNSNTSAYIEGAETDASGNVYIGGYFSGTVDFDPGPSTQNYTATSGQWGYDSFIAKYDATGNFVFVKVVTGGSVTIRSMTIDLSGNLYIGGVFYGATDFDPGIGVANLNGSSSSNSFFAKYNANGNLIYAKEIGSTNNYFFDIDVDNIGNAYLTGEFSSTIDLDAGAGSAIFSSAGDRDIYFAKYDVSGNYLFGKSFGGDSWDRAVELNLDASGNILLVGEFSGTSDFDPGAGNAYLTSSAFTDPFIAKYDPTGNYIFAKSLAGPEYEYLNKLQTDNTGAIYVSGGFNETIDLDPGPAIANQTSNGQHDIFIAKYSSDGNYIYGKSMGGPDFEYAYITALGSGSVSLVGKFRSTCDFDPGAGTQNLTANYGDGIFLAKYTETNGISTGAVSSACAGSTTNVPFEISGSFNAGNVFTAQLSNASGSFASPVNIGTLTGILSGSINASIPAGTAAGAGYLIRVISSNPALTGTAVSAEVSSNPVALVTPTTGVISCAITSVDLTASGGESYLWSDGSTSSVRSVTNSGTYTVTVTNAAGCTANASATISSNPTCNMAEISFVKNNATTNGCANGSFTWNLSGNSCTDYYYITIYKDNGYYGYYVAVETSSSGTFELTGLAQGNYQMTVNNGDTGCEISKTFIVTEPACNMAITAFNSINSNAMACNSGSAEASLAGTTCNGYYVAELTFDGNPYANYYPAETSGAGTISMSGLMAGNYVLNVNNGTACTQTQNFTISEPACNIAISTLSSTNLSGFGCNDGTLDMAFTGTTCNSYYIVNLTKDGSLYGSYYPVETSGAGVLNLTLLPAGNYTIEVTNGNAICSATQNFIITEPACNIVIANFATNNPTVNIGNNGGIIFNAQGSNCGGNYYYEIYNGGSLQTSGYVAVTGSSSPALISGLVAGSYELKLYSAYGSTCMASQTFTLTDAPCNVAISGLTANNISSGCGNGTINFNASGNTAYGYYTLLIEKDGSYYNSIIITPTGATTAYSITDLPVGAYALTLSDGAPTPCSAQQNISITEATCNVLITNPVLTEISVTGNNDGAVSGTMTGATCSGTYLVKLFNSGNFVSSQVVTTTNPNFTFQNLFAGIYQIQAFSGENVGNNCFNEYGFLLIDPCPVGNATATIDSTGGTCVFSTVHLSFPGGTDPQKLYTIQTRFNGGPWNLRTQYFGHPGVHQIEEYLSGDGHYEYRSGELWVIDICNLNVGFDIYKRYCDAYFTGISTIPATSECANGRVDISFNDPTVCTSYFRGIIYQNGDSIDDLSFGPSIGSNHAAYRVLPAGNYSYIIYTNTSLLDVDPKCPISGSFTIPNAGCNITFTNEVINNGCNGTEYSAQINGITCEGQFLVQLYKDGNLIESNNVYENSTVGNIGYGFLSPGNYTVKVFANHLNPGTCFAESNFTAIAMSCDLSIANLVVTNAAADLSTFGSVNFNVGGTECFGYQVTLKKNGVVYFGNNVTPTGALTPISFSSLPPDNYEIIFSNGFCEVSQLFTITQGNLSCNINYTNLTTSNVTTNGGSNGTINFTLNGNTCVSGQYEIEVYRNSVLLQSASYTATGSSTSIGLSNLPAGNIQVLVYNGCMSGLNECAITFASLLTEPPVCNLLVSVTNATIPGPGCSNGILTVNMQGNANGNDYVLNVTKNGNYVFSAGYPSGSAVTDVISNLSAGVYDLNLAYTGSGSCGSNASYTLTNTPCNLSIDDVVVTSTTNNWNSGSIAFDVNGTICETSSLQLLNATGTVLVNSTISASEGRLLENLDVGSYSIQVTTPGGCSINYPFVIDAFCDVTLFNESISLEGASSCTTGKISYYVNSVVIVDLTVRITNTDDLTVLYQSNVPNVNGIDVNEIGNIPVGNYTLLISNVSGNCTASYNFSIVPAPCSNLAFTNVEIGIDPYINCYGAIGFDLNLGNCPGSILELYRNGLLVNTSNLINSLSTETTGLLSGNYNYHLVTASGCILDYPFEITPVPCNVAISNVLVTTPSCVDIGQVTFDVTGNNICPGTTLELLNSVGNVVNSAALIFPGNKIFQNLALGNYTIRITTPGDCIVNYPITVNAFCDINLYDEIIEIVAGAGSCTTAKIKYKTQGTECLSIIKLTNNVTGIVSYQSNVPNWGGIENEIENILPGSYTLLLTNSTGSCTDSYIFEILPASCSNIAFTNVEIGIDPYINCYGAIGFDLNLGNCPGSILELYRNGLLVNTSNLINSLSTQTTGLLSGNYNYHLETASGCILDYPFEITPVPCNVAISNVLVTTPSCVDIGQVTFDVTGNNICPGTTLELLNSVGNVVNSAALIFPGNKIFQNLALGNYTIRITTPGDCIVNYPITVNAFCDINLYDEIIEIVAGAGSCTTAKIKYKTQGTECLSIIKLTNNVTGIVSYQSNVPNWGGIENEIENILPGSYTLLLTNSTGSCTDSYIFEILPASCSNIAFTNVEIGIDPYINCYGAIGFDLNLGNCPGSILELYRNGLLVNTSNLNNSLSTQTTGLLSGNYNYHLETASGCILDYPFEITPVPCNIVISNVIITPPTCAGNGQVTFNVAGNNVCPGTTVQLLNSTGTVVNSTIIDFPGNKLFQNLDIGNYTIQIISPGDCTFNYPFTITPNNCNITLTNSVITNTGVMSCSRGRIDFDVNGSTCGTGAVALIQNGTILNTINWTTGNGAGLNFLNLSPGDYYIVAVNNLLNVTCGDTITFNIPTNPCALSISNIVTSSTGVLGCTIGNVNFTVSGTFCQTAVVAIKNASNSTVFSTTMNSSGNQSYSTSGLPSGTYTIFFGNLGCYIEEQFNIAPNPCNLSINNVVVTPVSGSEGCTVASVSFAPMGDMCSNGFIQLRQNGSPIGTSILWNQNTAPIISFGNLSPGIYTLFVATYLPNFCMTSQDFEVFPTPCSLNIATVTSTPSNGSNGTINATGAGNYCGAVSFALDAEISAGNYNNITTNSGNIITQFNGLAPGNYRVTISSADSPCQDVEYITVNGAACNTNPIISATSTTVCPGLPVTLNSNYLTGNVWSNGGNSFNTQVTTAGTYTLTVTELNGCTGSTSITITNATTCVPVTQMNNGVCGTLNYVRTSAIGCLAVAGATQYEWQFSNTSGVFATKTTTTNFVLLHGVTPALNWGTNWNVKVRAKIGTNVGPYSTDCTIGIMPDPSTNGVPQTQLRTQDCNRLNYRINNNNRIIANPVAGAIQYEFEFSSAITGLVVATKLEQYNVLYLHTVTPSLAYPAQYNVRVRARIASTWGVYGTPCLIGVIGFNRDEANTVEETEMISNEINVEAYFEMNVFPNPFNEQATLNIHSSNDKQVNVEVFDMVGNIVWKQNVPSNTHVNFGVELAQGTYIVKAMNQNGGQAMFRFIKSK